MSWNITARLIVMIFAGLIVTSCSARQQTVAAETGVKQFREQMAAGKFVEMYEQADPDLKQKLTPDSLADAMKSMSLQHGNYQSSTRVGWLLNSGTDGTMVTLTYDTTFEKGKWQERFVFRIKDGIARLARYHTEPRGSATNKSEMV